MKRCPFCGFSPFDFVSFCPRHHESPKVKDIEREHGVDFDTDTELLVDWLEHEGFSSLAEALRIVSARDND